MHATAREEQPKTTKHHWGLHHKIAFGLKTNNVRNSFRYCLPIECNQTIFLYYGTMNHSTMQTYLFLFLLFPATWVCAQVSNQADSSELKSLSKSLDLLSEAAECWTPEQKQEFASVFFMERGKFTVPKEPIVLKSFEKP